jgi:hypothetical protein
MAAPKGNQYGKANLKYKTVEELESAIEEYFNYCDNRIRQVYSAKADGVIETLDPAPYTMSGLAYALGLDRKTILNYGKDERFSSHIKAARDRVEADVEERMSDKQTFTPGLIFNAKNNFGWVDAQRVDARVEQVTPILGGNAKENTTDDITSLLSGE